MIFLRWVNKCFSPICLRHTRQPRFYVFCPNVIMTTKLGTTMWSPNNKGLTVFIWHYQQIQIRVDPVPNFKHNSTDILIFMLFPNSDLDNQVNIFDEVWFIATFRHQTLKRYESSKFHCRLETGHLGSLRTSSRTRLLARARLKQFISSAILLIKKMLKIF